ncbi:helix-turn-helix domain-containing protein [Myroides pelagicus]|uniref:Helix-turn-helix domain-containing protein n=1 Tax=Myroides pelagicus TaxID=270914 RepID=A0A7K1GP07_9FLAO|nr:helix-turn-helix domain-containing protein [Myroides pelagicus]MEC4115079.1 helix-turn-helix domain-containing protein [Myroides pelagicus]MTH30576.1 helix-turn-helix domain-containing protein [Myroides pelagicus]
MNVNQVEFLSWMDRITKKIDTLSQSITQLPITKLSSDGEQLLDNKDVLDILKISNRSLQRYRSNKTLPYYKIQGKVYYKLSDITAIINQSLSKPINS